VRAEDLLRQWCAHGWEADTCADRCTDTPSAMTVATAATAAANETRCIVGGPMHERLDHGFTAGTEAGVVGKLSCGGHD